MALKTIVKVGSITNLSDARYCAGMGVEMLGFVIDPSHEYYLPATRYNEIIRWVSGVTIVGEMNETLESFESYRQIDVLQISDGALLKKVKEVVSRVILSIDLKKQSLSSVLKDFPEADYYLLQHSEDKIDDDYLNGFSQYGNEHQLILGFGVNPKNVNQIVNSGIFKGIELKGSAEIIPGYKDYSELADILEILEIENET